MKVVLIPEFVEFIPEVLEVGKIYISQTYATAVHKCCCGCGHKVVTPLSPTGWKLTVDGEYVSLHPSIGNWGFACESHYWIKRNVIHWSYQMSQQEIEAGRRHDAKMKERYFDTSKTPAESDAVAGPAESEDRNPKDSLWEKLKRWLLG
jgi:hypothetical protein